MGQFALWRGYVCDGRRGVKILLFKECLSIAMREVLFSRKDDKVER